MYNYSGKKIVILGLGLTGLSCLYFFLSLGIYPKIMDTRLNVIDINLIPVGVEYCLGYLNDVWLLDADLVVISPGICCYSSLILEVKKKGIEIINDIEIFFREQKDSLMILVTGTNGKSTVVTLLYNILKILDFKIILCGNIGLPVLDFVYCKADIFIIELSSFQLEHCISLNSYCSCILNITADHLDRYPNGIQDYVFSKLNILRNSKFCVINKNYVLPYFYNYFEKNIITFGKTDDSDYYTILKNKKVYLTYLGKEIINSDEILIKGFFNYVNILSVIAICDQLKVKKSIYLKEISKFSGLSHRFNFVSNKNGVLWINDSKSTNISSTISALKSLPRLKGNIWLFLGGKAKYNDLNLSLKLYLEKLNNIKVCCFGESSNLFYSLFPSISKKFIYMYDAFIYIFNNVKLNDIVLFSPGCSSLDHFVSFEHRGNYFIDLLKEKLILD